MGNRCFGFVLLIWFPGVLHAQSAAQPCGAPSLKEGYVVPEQDTYPHKMSLAYACYNGRKPVAEGWWATSVCENGKWSHEPQCIDDKSCLPPIIPNGKYTETQDGWYEEHHTITVMCEEGYQLKNLSDTSQCVNGTWTSLPVCEKSTDACSEPPKIPFAAIHQAYQEVFPDKSKVQFECQYGYATDGANTENSIICSAGTWTEAPKCNPVCVIDPARYGNHYQLSGVEHIKEREEKYVECIHHSPYVARVQCIDRKLSFSQCCHQYYMNQGWC